MDYLDLNNINGLDLYCYCNNNPINVTCMFFMYQNNNIQVNASIYPNIVSSLYNITNSIDSWLNLLFGYELRESAGWDKSVDIYTGWLGKIGYSSYITYSKGKSGLIYCFVGSTVNDFNWFGADYYAGIGFNIYDVIGFEFQLEAIGIGAQLSIGKLSISTNSNFIGTTSITFGVNNDLGNNITNTNGFTI